jgi:hypothetical protein
LVRGIPTGGPSSSVLDALNGRSFLLQMIYLNSFGQRMVGQFLEHGTPKDGQSLNVLDDRLSDLSGHSFLRHGLMSFDLSKDGQKMVGLFLGHEIPKDRQSEKLAYARLLNQNHESRYKKVCLTSSFFPGGRR